MKTRKKMVLVSAFMHPDRYKRVKQIARQRRISTGAVLRLAVDEFIDAQEAPSRPTPRRAVTPTGERGILFRDEATGQIVWKPSKGGRR